MTEPIHAVTSDSGSRFYSHPIRKDDDGQPKQYVSVTTVLDTINKPGLKFWASYGTAGLAMDELPRMIKAARRTACGLTRSKQACQECRPCVEYWLGLWHYREAERAKRRGSRVHKYREHWIKHGYWPQVEPGDEPYVDGYVRFVRDYGLTSASWSMTECTVLNHTNMYGGTLDGGLVIEPTTQKAAELCARMGSPDESILILDDLKTREKPDVAIYQESALQLTAYRYTEVILLPDGSEVSLPSVAGAVVVQVRPAVVDGAVSRAEGVYTCRPVDTSQQTMEAFVCALWLHRWVTRCGDQSVQVGSFPIPAGWDPPTPEGQPVGRPKRARKASPAATEPTTAVPPATSATAPKKANGRASAVTALRPRDGKSGVSLADDEIPF